MKQLKIGVSLGLILLALGGLATWDEWKTKQEEKDKETKNLVLGFKPEDVIEIELRVRPDGDNSTNAPVGSTTESVFILNKADGNWNIVSPIKSLADNQTIQDLLKNVSEFKYEADVADGESLRPQFGLDSPRRLVTLKLSSGSVLEFKVGNNAPVGYSTYIGTNQSTKILSGSQYIAASLNKSLFDLRDKSIFKFDASKIANFSYQSEKLGKTNLLFEKLTESWKINKDIEGDSIAIQNLISDFSDLKATEFLDEVKSPNDLIQKGTSIEIEAVLTLPEMGKIQVLKRGADRIVSYPGLTGLKFAKISSDTAGKLVKSLEDLRNKKIFSFVSNTVKEVEIDGASYIKTDDKWQQKLASDQKSDSQLEASFVGTLLIDLEHAKAERVMDTFEKSKNPPKHSIELDKSSPSRLMIQAWEEGSDQFVLKHSGARNFFLVKKSLLSSISPQTSNPGSSSPQLEDLGPPPP